VPYDAAATRFYGSVLDRRFHPGSVERGWQVADRTPPAGIGGDAERPEVQLCYLVEDVDVAVHRVRQQGGEAEEPAAAPYGRIATCVDNQGMHFQLLQAAGGAGAG
jgi:predicted enzyme related to lactoylglutathione lyase